MRRFLFGVVIASVTAAMPAWAFGGDREIAKAVMSELQEQKAAGHLKGFDIDLKVEGGIVYLTGQVATTAQRDLVVQAARDEVGEANVVTDLRLKGEKPAVELALPVLPLLPTPSVTPSAPAIPAATAIPAIPSAVQPASTVQNSTEPSASDMAITDSVIMRLQQAKSAGHLRGFELDVSTVNGDMWLRGKVANQSQKDLVLDVARRTKGVSRVIDDIAVAHQEQPYVQQDRGELSFAPQQPAAVTPELNPIMDAPVRQVSTGGLEPAASRPEPIPQVSSMPVAGRPVARPQAFAPAGVASATVEGGYVSGAPVPMQGAGGGYPVSAPRYDQPNMPSYAWPSYAAYPNYSAVTYPKQYSPSAWPYIGPFYPYPQVPLGWRKVALEWDDGLWYLDFTSK